MRPKLTERLVNVSLLAEFIPANARKFGTNFAAVLNRDNISNRRN